MSVRYCYNSDVSPACTQQTGMSLLNHDLAVKSFYASSFDEQLLLYYDFSFALLILPSIYEELPPGYLHRIEYV